MSMKIYFAGPNVFYPHVQEIDKTTKALCKEFSVTPLIPTDSELPQLNTPQEIAQAIFQTNVTHIQNCDIILANTTPFRGACIDDGTSWEIGMAYTLNKPVYTYSFGAQSTKEIIISECGLSTKKTSPQRDAQGFMIEDFGLSSNLMIACSVTKHFAGVGEFPKDYEQLLRQMLQEITNG